MLEDKDVINYIGDCFCMAFVLVFIISLVNYFTGDHTWLLRVYLSGAITITIVIYKVIRKAAQHRLQSDSATPSNPQESGDNPPSA